ncbi:MAG TPA: DUF4158 domain-containing protein [Kineosporiaceae bacterium]|nr:DUF4158 domain-containing protein [Kineosporiaceae bacterium]
MERAGNPPAGEGFLTAEQQRRYGRYADDPDQGQLDRYFHLDTVARELVDVRRGQHNRLGFAVQLGTVRFLGTFLPGPADVPWAVAAHLAAQLDIADPGVLKQYATRDGTNRLHAGEIQRVDLGEDAGGSVERRLGACSFGSGQPRVSRNTLVVVAACSAHTGRCGGGSRPAGPPPPPTGTGCATHKSTRPVRHASERLDKDRTVATPSLGPRRRQSTQQA